MKTWEHMLEDPGMEYRPEIRWWLAEGFHTDQTLKNDVCLLHEAGFGAVEFLAMEEPGADSSLYGWGSEEWVHDTHTIIREVTGRGMGASFTSGTNWSNANLPDSVHMPDDLSAAKELVYTVETLEGGVSRIGPLQKAVIERDNVHAQELISVVAIRKKGEAGGKPAFDLNSATVLTDLVADENLDWAAPGDGEWYLFAFWMHGTGQTASPSVSVSYTVNYMDHYGAEALIEYWNSTVLTPQLRGYIRQNGRVQMYMDSLELSTFGNGGQLWGYHMLEEFSRRRGYDLAPYLPIIPKEASTMTSTGPYAYFFEATEPDRAEKVRNDLYQTMTELYVDCMLKPVQKWLHGIGMTLRAEISYGLPFEISIPGKYVDGIETESMEFASQIESYRGLAGAAHLYGKIYSSETGATLYNYMRGISFYNQIIYTQFASGIARTVLHGYSSIAGSDRSTYWPGHEGMWPIYSERFGSRQPAYRHYRDWTAMLTRYQMLLRQGKPRVDLGILRLDYNFNNLLAFEGSERITYEERYMRANEGMYWKDMSLQNAGYTYDYFAPQILEDEDIVYADGVVAPDGPGYRALIIYQEGLPLPAAKRILTWARNGLPVVLVNNVTESLRPGGYCVTHGKAAGKTPFNDGLDGELTHIMDELKALKSVVILDEQEDTLKALRTLGIEPRAAFAEPNKSILTAQREVEDGRLLFLYNYMYTQDSPCTFTVYLDSIGIPKRVDCWTGDVENLGCYQHKSGRTHITMKLNPGEAAMLALDTVSTPELHAVSTTAMDVISRGGALFIKSDETGEYITKLSDGRGIVTRMSVPPVIVLDEWELEVEVWDEGERATITEDRGLGIITNEVYYETRKTKIHVGRTKLIPWKDMAALGPAVSGIGNYTASFNLPSDWEELNGATLRIGSTNGNTAAIYINGEKAGAYDLDAAYLDISDLLIPGRNTILIEVASTLNNRLLARGYYERAAEAGRALASGLDLKKDTNSDNDAVMRLFEITAEVQDYGMTGKVEIVPYTIEALFQHCKNA